MVQFGRPVDVGQAKTVRPGRTTFAHAVAGSALLSSSAWLAVLVGVHTGSPAAGVAVFPAGFVLLALLGLDLLTGAFVLVPLALLASRPGVTVGRVVRNWGLVLAGNLLGALMVASAVVGSSSMFGGAAVVDRIALVGRYRTAGYAGHGTAGMLIPFGKGFACNGAVGIGVLASLLAGTLGARVLALWVPTVLVYSMGLEHGVVNMFLFSTGVLAGGQLTVRECLLWNELPTLLGNLTAGLLLAGSYVVARRLVGLTGPVRSVVGLGRS